jgi:protocatechuate 3,4-dioxygenase beta subunit
MACSGKEQAAHHENKLPPMKRVNEIQIKTLPGGPCEGCEIMFLGMPLKLNAMDTTVGWFEEGQKLKGTSNNSVNHIN